MATAFPLPVTAAQVGTYFVGQYYQMLQNQPDFVHQFYSDASTMLRIDGHTRQTATAMLQIHQLVMSLNYMELEIKTAHSLESWNGGVLVMVSGSVHVKDFNGRKKFAETFFLAPQEKGYFVLNDIFQYVDEEQILQYPIINYLPKSNLVSKLNSLAAVQEQVSSYILGGDIQSREFATPKMINENIPVNDYNYREQQLAQVSETEKIYEDNFAVQSNVSIQGNVNSVAGHLSPPLIDEPIQERQKHTYASILLVAKEKSPPAVNSQTPINKTAPSEWQQVHKIPNVESFASSNLNGRRSSMETLEESSAVEDEVEVKSVYVKNVPTTMAASEIAEEFKKFGKLSPESVAIRTRKDVDGCYAFVEFEDISSVHNAIKASMVQIGPYKLRIEGRRPNRNMYFQGGRGRGRGSCPMQGTRGQFGGRAGFGRSGQDGTDRDYNNGRPRGNNSFYRQVQKQGSRNGSQ